MINHISLQIKREDAFMPVVNSECTARISHPLFPSLKPYTLMLIAKTFLPRRYCGVLLSGDLHGFMMAGFFDL